MSTVGPQLPPELQKRKRNGGDTDEDDSSDSSTGPLPQKVHPQKQSPPSSKRVRVIGPSLPPAPLDERPSHPPQPDQDEDGNDSSDDDDDDDDFGPALPSAADVVKASSSGPHLPQESTSRAPAPAQRDEWMTLAPTSGDWSQRVDPTKLKNRKFNTGRGAKAPSQTASGGDQSWHETPEQKQARLKREVLGIKDSTTTTAKSQHEPNAHDEETARRLKEYNVSPTISLATSLHALQELITLFVQEKQRGASLYAAHNASSKPIEEDDPSARAFDREKDIAGGATINSTKRREMLKKAADFSSRFGEARYL